jgi:type II secretory pathway component GspD/PulD (secretin)
MMIKGKRKILCAAVLGVLPLIAGCASTPARETAELGKWGRAAEHPVVLSGNPNHDTAVYNASEEQLSEADWKILEQLGPKAIWERIGAMNRAARERRSAHPATTQSLAANGKASTRPTLTLEDVEKDTPVIQMPDGKIRMIYALRNYGGQTITTATDAGTSRRTVSSKAPDLAPLVAVLSAQLGDGSMVAALPNENTVVITCAPVMKKGVMQLLTRLDQPPRQVEITAKMFEVSHDFDCQYGAQLMVNRVASDGTQGLSSVFSTRKFLDALAGSATGGASEAVGDGSVLTLMKVFQDAGISVDATFQLLSESGLINVVASPRMTVAAGQTGYMLAGSELPIQSSTVVNSAETITTSYKPVGVQLYITPQAMGPDSVKLHAISVVSAISGFVPLPTIQGDQQPSKLLINPVIDSREAETTVTLEDGNTLVFGGLRMIRTTSRESKMPGLGDIPVLGWLFKNHRSQKQQTDLYFFVTPSLL